MKLKSKMIASIMSICLVCAVFAIGVFALKTANLKIGGVVSFSATGVEADIKNVTLTGATTNDQVLATGSINTSMTQADIDSTFQNWQTLKLDFDENATDIELKFDIANTSTNADNYIEIDYSYTFNNPNPNVDVFPGDENGEGVWENNNYILTPKGANPADTDYETFVLKFSILDKELNVPADTSVSLNINLKHITPIEDANINTRTSFKEYDDPNAFQFVMPEGEICWSSAPVPENGILEIPAVIKKNGVNYIVTKMFGYMLDMYSNSDLCKLIIPNSVREIVGLGDFFSSCNNLTEVILPNSMTVISESFTDCTGLKTLKLPNSMTLFSVYLDSLESIEIPRMLTGLYFGRTACNSIKVQLGNKVYDSRDNCNAVIETETNKLVLGCKNTIIPDSVVRFGEYAFSGVEMESFTIPEQITYIEDCALNEISGLKTVNYNAINCVFNDITDYSFPFGISTINIGDKVEVLPSQLFMNASIKSLIIPKSVRLIDFGALYGKSGLDSVEFEEIAGWVYASSLDAEEWTPITGLTKEASETNATLLTETYANYYWKRIA